MVTLSMVWVLTLTYRGLWKRTYIDENAISPSQVTMYFDWSNVHKADTYLDQLEQIVEAPFDERVHSLSHLS